MLIRLYSHIHDLTGYGRAGLELARCLIRAGHDLEIAYTPPASEPAAEVDQEVASCVIDERLASAAEVVIVHTLPYDCARTLPRIPGVAKMFPPHTKVIAYTTWETPQAPQDLCASLDVFDQVWVPSGPTEIALATPDLEGKLRVVPHAFDEARWAEFRVNEPASTISRPYRFYYVGAWTERKNPAGLIRAYTHAFTSADPVELVLQVGPAAPVEQIALAAGACGVPADRQPKIRLGLKTLSNAELAELHDTHDCFVTASRGEAWNFGAFDAMIAGNHLIVPRGHGSDDYLANTTAALYGSHPVPATVDAMLTKQEGGRFGVQITTPPGVNAKIIWDDPNLVTLATYMRAAARDRVRRLRGPDPRALFGYEAVSKRINHYLQEL